MEGGFIVSGKVKMTIESKVGTKALTVYLGNEKVVESEEKKLVVELNAEKYPKGLHNLMVIASVDEYRRHIEEYGLLIENARGEAVFGGRLDDWANAVIQTQDGGYLIVGGTWSFGAGGSDVYVLKLDKNGNKQWEKTFGGEDDDEANAVVQTPDGGYLIVGGTKSFGAGWDVYVLKLDKNGKKQWEKTFGGEYDDWANAVVQTQDGGYLIVGTTRFFEVGAEDVYVLKLDKNGKKQWEKAFDGKYGDRANAVVQTQDGGYLIVGATGLIAFSERVRDPDVHVLKLDKNGKKQWENAFGGAKGDLANAVIQTQDGGYLIFGGTWSFGAGGSDVYIIFLDKSGNVKMMK
jgi:WD40 repeat protein